MRSESVPRRHALKQNTLTSGGLTATSRSVFYRRSVGSERDVGDGPTVVSALVFTGHSETEHAHVRGTDGYIALGFYRHSVGSERDVGDGPTVVRALVFTGRSGSDRARVRGTDGYIALGFYRRSVGSERDVGDAPRRWVYGERSALLVKSLRRRHGTFGYPLRGWFAFVRWRAGGALWVRLHRKWGEAWRFFPNPLGL